MKVLELFSGTERISKAFRKAGHETFTVDFEKRFNPDLCIDILDFDISKLPKEWRKPNVIWASPPCQTFSVASLRHYWINGKPRSYRTYIGLAIAKKTFEIIEELKPNYWFIENPTAMLRKQSFTFDYHRKSINYCQYGSKEQKPTDIWTNAFTWITKKKCYNGSKCHESAKRGEDKGIQSLSGQEARGVIPKGLAEEIVKVCEDKLKEKQEVLK